LRLPPFLLLPLPYPLLPWLFLLPLLPNLPML
jgi:hypothetical protein